MINAGFPFEIFYLPSFSVLVVRPGLSLPDGDFHCFRALGTTKADVESFSISDPELPEKQ